MKEDSILNFKWQSFPANLIVSFDTCYEKQQFVDLSLVCKDGTVIKCHKMVLANSSSFFRRLLLANDHPHPMIILHDIEADDLKTLVNFMYCGEIQVVQSEVRRLLKLAEILQITGLQHIPSSLLFKDDSIMKEHYSDASKKTVTTMSRLKMEETRNSSSSKSGNNSSGSGSEHEIGATRVQIRQEISKAGVAPTPQVRVATYPPKTPAKAPPDVTRKKEEININELCQRLETSNSGISIVDVNDIPSTSKGLQSVSSTVHKRKEFSDNVISWPHILSAISKDNPLPLKKLCIMDEVEIMPSKPLIPTTDNKQNEPLDRRKSLKSSSDDHNMNMVFIKDEIDILSEDMEEDVDMDPLEVDEIDNENADGKTVQQFFNPQILYHQLGKNTRPHTEFPPRKDSNS